jgi:hypothetical protein
MEHGQIAIGLWAIGLMLLLGMLIAGMPKIVGATSNHMANSTNLTPQTNVSANITENTTNETKVVCYTTRWLCLDGAESVTVNCTNNQSSRTPCEYSPPAGVEKTVPEKYRYMGMFKCYWDIRQKYGYGDYFDPFAICQEKQTQQTAGWEDSCECAAFIEKYVKTQGYPGR